MKPKAIYRDRMQRYQDSVWLIWSNKWSCWYRENSQGYTNDIAQAGIFDRETAAKHYIPDRPKRHRDTEPFPLSSVQAMMRGRIKVLRAEIAAQQALIIRLDALTPARMTQHRRL